MSKFEQYNIVLKDIKEGSRTVELTLDDTYFKKIDSPEVQRGNVKTTVTVHKKTTAYELQFNLDGFVYVPCDRCLDDMEQPISYKEKLLVKFGDKFAEEDDIVIVPEADGAINIAWFLYEFIVLNIPIKHVHPTGECNKSMVSKLKKHIARQKDDDDDSDDDVFDFEEEEDFSDESTDPRWDKLQNIIDNN